LFKKISKYQFFGFSDVFFKNFKVFLKKKIETGKSFVCINDKLRIFSNILLNKHRFGIFRNPSIFTIENHFFLLSEYFYNKSYADLYFMNKLVSMLSIGIFTDKFLKYGSINKNISRKLNNRLSYLYINFNVELKLTPKNYSNYIINHTKLLNKFTYNKNINFTKDINKEILLIIKLNKIYKKKKKSKLNIKFNNYLKKKTIPVIHNLEKYV
jgi:hypothetical protein